MSETATSQPGATAANADGDLTTYRWASLTLRSGMYLSFAAMITGLGWWLVAGMPGGADLARQGLAPDQLWNEMASLNPLALLNLGVLLLLATPGVTLITEIVTYAMARNWRFAGVATLVAAILLLSLAFSIKWIKLF